LTEGAHNLIILRFNC